MKKNNFFSILLAAVLLFGLFAPPAAAQAGDTSPAPAGSAGGPEAAFDAAISIAAPELTCGAAILVDGDNDEILFARNAHQRLYPASITKIMTNLLVLEAVERGQLSLDQEITASSAAIAAVSADSSSQNIQPGEVMTVRNLMYCALIASACEACNVLAEAVAGSISEFVDRMNQRAAELGMTDTHYANPHGLHDPQHYTSAYDVYLVAHEAMKHDTFRTIVSTAKHEVPATNISGTRVLYNTNALINNWFIQGYTYSKAIGIKTGSTPEAGYCLTSAAVDPAGRTFYCVVLNAQVVKEADGTVTRYQFKESRELLEWGFQNFQRISLLDESADLWEVQVTLSDEQDHVVVQPKGSIVRTMPTDFDPEKVELIPVLPDSVEAPVEAGQTLGSVTLSYNGETYGTLDLVTVSGAARSETQYRLKVFKEYVDLWWVKALIAAVGVLLVALVVLAVAVSRGRRRRSRGYHYSGNRRRRY